MEKKLFWSEKVISAVKDHVNEAISRLDPDRYTQEAAYVSALVARLDGVVYDGEDARVEIISTVVSDRGRGSPESKWGADFTITANMINEGSKIKKAVLGQAKRGNIKEMSTHERGRLDDQISKMLQATDNILILETPISFGDDPRIIVNPQHETNSMVFSLDEYLTGKLMLCLHGDTRGGFVRSAQSSQLTGLQILASDSEKWPS